MYFEGSCWQQLNCRAVNFVESPNGPMPLNFPSIWNSIQGWQNSQFGFWHLEQTLPDYHILSDKLYILPFLFWVQFLRQLIGIFHFSWFSPGSRLYEMVYTNANDVDQPPSSVSDCRLVLLIRLALYQYGYITDVPLNRMFVRQAPSIPNRNIFFWVWSALEQYHRIAVQN